MLEPIKDAFEEFEVYEDFSDLKTDQLLTEIWLKPKKVFAYIFKHEPQKYVQALLLVAAFANAGGRALEKNVGGGAYGFGFFLGMAIIGGLITYLLYYVMAWFLKFFGNAFLNGKANSKDYRTVIAWSTIPTILSFVTTLFLVIVYGSNALSTYEPTGYVEGIVYIIIGLIEIGLAIWSTVILVTGIMHIQKFGVWKAIANVFLPVIILIMIFVIIFVLGDIVSN